MRWVLVLVVVASLGCETRAPRPVAAGVASIQAKAPAQRVFADRRAAFAAAYRDVQEGNFERARPILESIVADYPELEDYCLYYLATGHARAGRKSLAVSLLQRLLSSQPQSVHFAPAALKLGRALLADGDGAGARAAFLRARDAGSKDVHRSATLALARLDLADGNLASAYDRFMALRRDAPGTAVGNEAKREVEALRRRSPDLAPTGSALRAELELLVKEGDHAGAIALADRLIAVAPSIDRPGLMRLRADAEAGAGRIDESLATLRQIYRLYPDSPEAPSALFRRARTLWNRDRTTDAEAAFRYLLRRYPRHGAAPDALYALARIDEAAGNWNQALANYRRLTRAYPRAAVAPEAGWRIGWVLYQNRQWRQAAEAFGQASRRWRSIANDSIYWQARALEHGGHSTEARALYRRLLDQDPTNYYAYWAEKRLGSVASRAVTPAPPGPSGQIPPDAPGPADGYHLTRAHELQAAGLPDAALTELRAFERSNTVRRGMVGFLLDAYRAVDGYRDAIRLAQRVPQPDPFVLYPLAFWPRVTSHTTRNGADPLLVLSLMRQESMFDPGALSPANARGLMQLLPSTAVEAARRIGKPPPRPGDLYDPDVNITLGVAHFRYLLDLYGGNRFKALAAYNGGERAVERWDRQFGSRDLDEWVESITYRETRKYVKKVLSNQRAYRELYGWGTWTGS